MTNDIITTLHPDQDPNTNLFPNIKKENIPSKSIDRNKLGDDVISLLNSINELHPSGVDTSTNILAFITNKGIYIGSDTGHWYYWDGTSYVDGGTYQATEIVDNSITNKKINNNVKKDNYRLLNEYREIIPRQFYVGTLTTNGLINYNNVYGVTFQYFLKVKANSSITVNSNLYTYQVCEYTNKNDSSFTAYSGVKQYGTTYYVTNDCYIRICIRNANAGTPATDSLFENLVLNIITDTYSYINGVNIEKIKNTLFIYNRNVNYKLGKLDNGGNVSDDNTRVVTTDFIKVGKGSTIAVDDYSYKFNLCKYTSPSVSSLYEYRAFYSNKEPYVIEEDCYIKFCIGSVNNDILIDTSISEHLNIKLITSSYLDYVKLSKSNILYRNVYLNNAPSGLYYESLDENFDKFTAGTQYTNYINELDSLISNYPNYINKIDLGASSDGQHLFEYHFKPITDDASKKDNPKIIIITGQHGGEKTNSYGLYYLLKDILINWDRNPILEYIRNNIELIILPIANPYGFDHYTYKNANQVNLNRNWDANWVYVEDINSSNYAGAQPFDQVETQIMRDLILNNEDAFCVIDSHTNSGSALTDNNMCWFSLVSTNNEYYNKLYDLANYTISKISLRFKKEFNLTIPDNTKCGDITYGLGNGYLRTWCFNNNIMSFTLEGFSGFIGESVSTPATKKANAEIIGNTIINLINEYVGD